MTAFAEYLLKVIICSGVLTGYYWLALRNKLFHSWNRYYLLAAVIISLLLPFVKISFITEPQPENLPAYTILQTVTTNEVWFPEQTTATPETFTKEQLSFLLYFLVSIALFVTLLVTLLRIKKLITAYEHWKMKDLTFVDTDAKGTPFSFLHYIFWNRAIDFESAQGQQIFKHELIHVKEKHSIDKLFLQLVLIVFWINPFFWIIRKELTMIHEFIADRKSVKDSDASALAAMILTAAFPGHTLSLTNPFFYSPIKRRLLMLSKLQNPKVGYISRLLLLPLLTFLFTAFAVKIKENDRSSSIPRLEKQLTVVIDAGHGFIDGKRHGALGLNGISEDEIALAIAKKIEQMNTDENLKLIITRQDENFIENKERVKITEENNADLFISLHANYAPKIREDGKEFENPMNGFELYVPLNGTANLPESKELGSAIISEIKNFMTIREPGIKQRNKGLWVLDAAPCPAVLLECGFISNSKNLAFLTNEKNQEKIAEAVLKGIVNYAKSNITVSVNNSTDSIRIKSTTIKIAGHAKNTPPIMMLEDKKTTLTADTIILKDTLPIYIINGKRMHPDSVKLVLLTAASVTVLKGTKETIAKYGPDAKNGVILIEKASFTKEPPLATRTQTSEPARQVFTKAEIMPTFQGGENAWNRYTQKVIKDNISKLLADGKEGTCEVRFIVSKEGTVSDIEVITMKNTKLASIAIEAIANGPKWVPAIQNGKHVHCWTTQKLTLRLPVSQNAPISVANAFMQNLFIGIDNPLVISMGNTPGSQLHITSNNGTVTNVNGTWVARPAFEGKAIITVTDQNTNQEAKVIFTAKQLAVPAISFGDSKGGRVSAQKILQAKKIDIDPDWEITNYTIYFTGRGFPKPFSVAGNKSSDFNQRILEAIAKCQPGTTIVIDEIAATSKKTELKSKLKPLAFNLY